MCWLHDQSPKTPLCFHPCQFQLPYPFSKPSPSANSPSKLPRTYLFRISTLSSAHATIMRTYQSTTRLLVMTQTTTQTLWPHSGLCCLPELASEYHCRLGQAFQTIDNWLYHAVSFASAFLNFSNLLCLTTRVISTPAPDVKQSPAAVQPTFQQGTTGCFGSLGSNFGEIPTQISCSWDEPRISCDIL